MWLCCGAGAAEVKAEQGDGSQAAAGVQRQNLPTDGSAMDVRGIVREGLHPPCVSSGFFSPGVQGRRGGPSLVEGGGAGRVQKNGEGKKGPTGNPQDMLGPAPSDMSGSKLSEATIQGRTEFQSSLSLSIREGVENSPGTRSQARARSCSWG
jgi:hypothetical protein